MKSDRFNLRQTQNLIETEEHGPVVEVCCLKVVGFYLSVQQQIVYMF